MKRALRIISRILLLIAAILLIYFGYIMISYHRIEDNLVLTPEGTSSEEAAQVGKPYTIVTQNIGFGAYTPDFTFFMDGGKQSRAESEESVIDCTNKAADTVLSLNPDFVCFQEVDTDSTRSWQVNQQKLLAGRFPGFTGVFAVNYDSAYLLLPIHEPHGEVDAGIYTLSRIEVLSALRRSLPISTNFSKFLDLDRCYTLSRIPVANGKELVLYNTHLSAYGSNDSIRSSQVTMLLQDMKSEYEKGNYCICGGDFNHDFTGDSTVVLSGGAMTDYGWAQPFPEELIPDGIRRCMDYSDEQLIPTCRNCDVPYGTECQTFVLDGFLVSDNVKALELHNIDTGFVYSDHNPVMLKFVLEDPDEASRNSDKS